MPQIELPLTVGGQKLFYTDINPADGNPCVLLLHANPGSSSDFNGIIPMLEAAKCRVVGLDWPSYGQSPPATDDNLVKMGALFFFQVLKEFIKAINLPPCIIIGNSVGGNAAVRLAVEDPSRVTKLILVSPGGFTRHNFFSRRVCRFMGTSWALSPRTFAGIYLGHHNAPIVKEMLARASGEQASGPSLKMNRSVWTSFAVPEHDSRKLLQAQPVSIPVMLVFGKHDPVIPYWNDGKEARKCLPNAKFVVMDSGHAPFAEIPEEFMKQVLPFCTE